VEELGGRSGLRHGLEQRTSIGSRFYLFRQWLEKQCVPGLLEPVRDIGVRVAGIREPLGGRIFPWRRRAEAMK